MGRERGKEPVKSLEFFHSWGAERGSQSLREEKDCAILAIKIESQRSDYKGQENDGKWETETWRDTETESERERERASFGALGKGGVLTLPFEGWGNLRSFESPLGPCPTCLLRFLS